MLGSMTSARRTVPDGIATSDDLMMGIERVAIRWFDGCWHQRNVAARERFDILMGADDDQRTFKESFDLPSSQVTEQPHRIVPYAAMRTDKSLDPARRSTHPRTLTRMAFRQAQGGGLFLPSAGSGRE